MLFLNLVQGLNLVAIDGSLLEGQRHACRFHGGGQTLDHFLLLAEQEHRSELNIGSVVL